MNRTRTIVLTGCTRGIGRAMAERFAELGHTVAGCGRSAKQIAALSASLPSPSRFDVVDVSGDDAVRSWAASVLNSVGVPDLVINNAGLINETAPLWEVGASDFDAVIDVNLKGVANVIRHFVPPMVDRLTGVIVNLSSGWGRSVDAGVAPYCTTEWGVEGMTGALALDLPDGMAAVALNPGVINTDMLRSSWSETASAHQSPYEWAERAVPLILGIEPGDNGKSMTV